MTRAKVWQPFDGATTEYPSDVTPVRMQSAIMKRESTGGTHIVSVIDDYSEFVKLVAQRDGISREDASSARDGHGDTWDMGVESVGAWCELARGAGYADAVEGIETLAESLRNQVVADVMGVQWEQVRDVAGSAVDVAAFCSGEPECMLEAFPMPVPAKGRAIRLYMPIEASGGVRAESMVRRGAAVVALADLCSQAGRPVEVWVGSERLGKSDKHTKIVNVRVQRADQPLDVARVALALCHPATLRRAGFALTELESEPMRDMFKAHTSEGMGMPIYEGVSDCATLPIFIDDDYAGTTLRVAGGIRDNSDARFGSADRARAWIVEQLREAEVM